MITNGRSNGASISIIKTRPFKVIVCVITLAAFFVNIFCYDLAWAATLRRDRQSNNGLAQGGPEKGRGTRTPLEPTAVGSNRAGSPDSPGFIKELNVDAFTLPEYMGRIQDSYKGASGKVVIHIQDAHCNYAAQQKISEIVEYLNKEYGIDTVNLEGGAKGYDLSIFTRIADKDIRKKVSDYFVKEGLVNGAEYFAVNNPEKAILWGIEDTKLYIDNLNVYRESLKHKDEVDKHLKALTHILNNLKLKIYSRELLQFDAKYSQYKAGTLEFKDYLACLIQTAKEKTVDIKTFTNIYLLSQTLGEEKKIDFKKANNQRDDLIDKLHKKLSKKSIEELVLKTVEFKGEKISQKEFYAYLAKKAGLVGVELKDFPELAKYIVYISMYSAIDKLKIMEEMDNVEDKIKDALYQNDKQKELDKLSKNLAILKNIFNISLTRDDYKYYTDNKGSFGAANYTSFINRESPLYKITARLDSNFSDLDRYREEISKFYECSFKRDNVFMKNIRFGVKGLSPTPRLRSGQEGTEQILIPNAAIVVTGGFHTDNLCEKFKKEDVSYISIMPNFTNGNGYTCPYFKILSGSVNIKDMEIDAKKSLGLLLATTGGLNGLAKEVNPGIVDLMRRVCADSLPIDASQVVPKDAPIRIRPLTASCDIFVLQREGAVKSKEGFIVTSGIGPCVAVSLYNYENNIGALAHFDDGTEDIAAAFSTLIKKLGDSTGNVKARIVGGQTIQSEDLLSTIENILNRLKIPVIERDVLGTGARAVALDVSTGELYDFVGKAPGETLSIPVGVLTSKIYGRSPLRVITSTTTAADLVEETPFEAEIRKMIENSPIEYEASTKIEYALWELGYYSVGVEIPVDILNALRKDPEVGKLSLKDTALKEKLREFFRKRGVTPKSVAQASESESRDEGRGRASASGGVGAAARKLAGIAALTTLLVFADPSAKIEEGFHGVQIAKSYKTVSVKQTPRPDRDTVKVDIDKDEASNFTEYFTGIVRQKDWKVEILSQQEWQNNFELKQYPYHKGGAVTSPGAKTIYYGGLIPSAGHLSHETIHVLQDSLSDQSVIVDTYDKLEELLAASEEALNSFRDLRKIYASSYNPAKINSIKDSKELTPEEKELHIKFNAALETLALIFGTLVSEMDDKKTVKYAACELDSSMIAKIIKGIREIPEAEKLLLNHYVELGLDPNRIKPLFQHPIIAPRASASGKTEINQGRRDFLRNLGIGGAATAILSSLPEKILAYSDPLYQKYLKMAHNQPIEAIIALPKYENMPWAKEIIMIAVRESPDEAIDHLEVFVNKSWAAEVMTDIAWLKPSLVIANYVKFWKQRWAGRLTKNIAANFPIETLFGMRDHIGPVQPEGCVKAREIIEVAAEKEPEVAIECVWRYEQSELSDQAWSKELVEKAAPHASSAVIVNSNYLMALDKKWNFEGGWAKPIIKKAILNDPSSAITELLSQSSPAKGVLNEILGENKSPEFVILSKMKDWEFIKVKREDEFYADAYNEMHINMYTRDAAALLHGIVKGDIKLDDAIKIAQDKKRLFRELVRIKKYPKHIGAAAVEAVLNKACLKFVQRMNELHNSLPSIRFASAKDLTAEELYVLIVYGESEVFTSTFNGLFNMLTNRMGREGLSGTTLLDRVNYNKFRAFVKLLASYGRLNEFLKTMTREAGSEFLERFAKDIDKESDSLAEAVIVADVFGLVKDRSIQINFQKTVRNEYRRARGEHSKEGIALYSLLSGMFGMRSAGGDQWLREVSRKYKLPTLSKLSAGQLFDRNGINFQRYHFYGESAGVESFSNFLAQYKNDQNWAVKDEGMYVHIASKRVKGKKVEIYANKWDSSDEGNTAIDQLLDEKKVSPSVIVYRGHSYQVEPDLASITPNAALVFLGSCGGYQNLTTILQKAPQAHIISTKGTGSMYVNDPMLKILNDFILAHSGVEWRTYWAEAGEDGRIKRNRNFNDYVRPDQNLGAIFLKAYRSILLDLDIKSGNTKSIEPFLRMPGMGWWATPAVLIAGGVAAIIHRRMALAAEARREKEVDVASQPQITAPVSEESASKLSISESPEGRASASGEETDWNLFVEASARGHLTTLQTIVKAVQEDLEPVKIKETGFVVDLYKKVENNGIVRMLVDLIKAAREQNKNNKKLSETDLKQKEAALKKDIKNHISELVNQLKFSDDLKKDKDIKRALSTFILFRTMVEARQNGRSLSLNAIIRTEKLLDRDMKNEEFTLSDQKIEASIIHRPRNSIIYNNRHFKFGGDGFLARQINDDIMLLGVLDVTGHDFTATLVKAAFISWLKEAMTHFKKITGIKEFKEMGEKERQEKMGFVLKEAFKNLDKQCAEVMDEAGIGDMLISCEMVCADYKHENLYYLPAGHQSLSFVDENGAITHEPTTSENLVLGLGFAQDNVYIKKFGSIEAIYLFSDGVYEISGIDGKQSNVEAVHETIARSPDKSTAGIVEAADMYEREVYGDDFTIGALKLRGKRVIRASASGKIKPVKSLPYPSLEELESKIFAVHATPVFPLNGVLKAGALKKYSEGETSEEPPSFRPVIHFSLGELVQKNRSANWDNVPYAIVAPLPAIEKQLINISPYDSFVLGDFKLIQGCVLIVPKGTDISTVPAYVEIREYEAKIGLRSAVEQVVKAKEGWQVRMVPSTSIGAVAYLDDKDINYPEFFTSLFEKIPQLSYGNDIDSERGDAFRFGVIEQALNYALQKLTTLPILELRFYKAVITHNLEALEKTLRSQSFPPETMAVFEDKKSNVLRWVSGIDKEMERRPNNIFKISPIVLAAFLYILSPQELNEFVAKNQGLFLYTDPRKFNIEYAIRRWLLVKSEQAKKEGLSKVLDEGFGQIKVDAMGKDPDEWPFDIVKRFLTMNSNRLGVALEILRHDAFSDYFSRVHGIVFKDNGPQTLEDVLRAYPITKILFDAQTYALSPDQQIAAQFLQKIDIIYQTAITENTLRDISKATYAAIEKEYLHNRFKKDLDTIMLPMNTAKGIEEMQKIGDELNLYQLLKRDNKNAMEIWKKVGLEKEFRQMFPSDGSFWGSELSLFEVHQRLSNLSAPGRFSASGEGSYAEDAHYVRMRGEASRYSRSLIRDQRELLAASLGKLESKAGDLGKTIPAGSAILVHGFGENWQEVTFLADRFKDCKVIGVDWLEKNIEEARKHIGNRNVELICDDIRNVNLTKQPPVKLIYMSYAIDYKLFEDDEVVMKEIINKLSNLLSKDGFVVSVPANLATSSSFKENGLSVLVDEGQGFKTAFIAKKESVISDINKVPSISTSGVQTAVTKDAIEVRRAAIIKARKCEEDAKSRDPIAVIGLPWWISKELKDKNINPEAYLASLEKEISRMHGAKGYGDPTNLNKFKLFFIEEDMSATKNNIQKVLDSKAVSGRKPDQAVVVFVPQVVGSIDDAYLKSFGNQYTVIPDAYSDIDTSSARGFPDVDARIAITRLVAWCKEAEFRENIDAQTAALSALAEYLGALTGEQISPVTDLSDLLRKIALLRIRPVDYKDITDWRNSYEAVATAL